MKFFKDRAKNKAKVIQKTEKAIQSEFKTIISHLNRDDLSDYVRYLRSPWHIWWNNFFAGMARGLGFVIGATILVSIFVYLFVNVLVNLPIVGDTFQWVSENVKLEEIQNLGNSLYQLTQMQQEQIDLLKQLAR